ncbi:MAG: hypothetical protein MI919_31650, partial [Holophagales bacterium]|nr:hypothetical protein [Holophagales bacterium]
RILANYRTLGEEAVAAVVGRRALAEGGAHHRSVLRLLLAFQQIRATWDDESEQLRRELGRRLAGIGEVGAARRVVDSGRAWGPDRSELHALFDRLAAESAALEPLLEQIRRHGATEAGARQLLEALGRGESAADRRRQLAKRRIDPEQAGLRLVRALGAYRPDQPDARVLAELVESYRQLLLPERARHVLQELTRSPDLPAGVIDDAVRLAADDLQPALLTDLADLQAARGFDGPGSLVARAAFQFALNDQQGLIQTLTILSQRLDRGQLFGLIAADPQLGLLAEDYRFREFMIRTLGAG